MYVFFSCVPVLIGNCQMTTEVWVRKEFICYCLYQGRGDLVESREGQHKMLRRNLGFDYCNQAIGIYLDMLGVRARQKSPIRGQLN